MLNRTAFALSCACAIISAANGQTWVSAATGSDSNSCTLTAPCKTFQRAVNVTPAWGQVGVLSPGDYGSVSISQAITIDGGGMVKNVTTTTVGIDVQAPATAVVQLRNMSIHGNGASWGIFFSGGGQLIVENMKVNGFNASCVYLGPNGTGTSDVVIKDSSIDNCSQNGIEIVTGNPQPVVSVEVVNSQVHYANVGLYSDTGTTNIYGSTFSSPGYGNGNTVGISVQSYPSAFVLLDHSQVSDFGVGVSVYLSSAQLNNTTISSNSTGLQVLDSKGAIISNGNNSFANNGTNGAPTLTLGVF